MYHIDCSKEAYGIYWLIIEITMDTQTYTHWFIWIWHTSRMNLAKYFFFPHYNHMLQSQTASLIRQVNSLTMVPCPSLYSNTKLAVSQKHGKLYPTPSPSGNKVGLDTNLPKARCDIDLGVVPSQPSKCDTNSVFMHTCQIQHVF